MAVPLPRLDSSLKSGSSLGINSRPVSAAAPAASGALAPVREQKGERLGVWRYSTQLNEQLTAGQRALDYVDELSDQLTSLKLKLSQELGQRRVDAGDLGAKVAGFSALWADRSQRTGGSVDGRLKFHLAQDAKEVFRIRGLELESLSSGQAEMLTFYTGVRGTGPASVAVGSEVSSENVLRQFNRALAPSGIRTEADQSGALTFSVAEDALAPLQNKLAIRGGGIRFPAGQANRLKIESEAVAISPNSWAVDDHASVRQSLQKVVIALEQLEQTRAAISSAMGEAKLAIEQLSTMNESQWAQSFVGDFNARFNQSSDYRFFSDIAPALMGMSRYRVLSLLALR
ncbi:hypothetical protein HA050_12290 [Iodobacter sp. HSC-16F04]|uniref:Flagellin n=1 Tax=Iodobacter violaceini TaxID=3044271 RepID=A0ABX0L0L3_9NEIS|nr:hypothetical protein [Iodobacter violacea]NHQ86896.1 hypothetical protein [Iodobacter violacea]